MLNSLARSKKKAISFAFTFRAPIRIKGLENIFLGPFLLGNPLGFSEQFPLPLIPSANSFFKFGTFVRRMMTFTFSWHLYFRVVVVITKEKIS